MESSLSACTVRGQFTTIPKNLKSALAPMVYTRIYKLFMMNRDSDATEIEDESLHLYFSSEESASLLSGSPQRTQNTEEIQENVFGLRRSPRKSVKSTSTFQKRQLSLPVSEDLTDNAELPPLKKKTGSKSQSTSISIRDYGRKSSQQLRTIEAEETDCRGRSTFEVQELTTSSDSGSSDDNINQRSQSRKKNTSEVQDRTQSKTNQRRVTLATPINNKTPESTTSRNQSVRTPFERTPTTSNGNALKTLLSKILANQNEIMEQLSIVKRDVKGIKEEIEKKKQETSEPIQIPNRIRSAVKDAFINGQQISLSWNCSKRFMDEENLEMTDFIRKSIQGIAPDENIDVINAAIKRYFTSQKEAANRQRKNKTESHKKRQATYERKKEKLKRRSMSIEKKSGWSKEKKAKVSNFLKLQEAHKYMSSDEEVDDGFLSHPYSWESEEWRRIKDSLDKKFLETCPPRSKRLLAKRTRGSVREQEPPKVDITHSWVIDES
ncbi:uncharacterized protein LOC111103079 [Crassostrea virginica]